MLSLLLDGKILVFLILLIAIVISLSLHEFGHAGAATLLGDDTPRTQGRLTLNPAAHIEAFGLLLVVLVGFGYARPVPINPRNLRRAWGGAAVAAAGPLMNLLLAVAAVNLLAWADQSDTFVLSEAAVLALLLLAKINLLLMLFNLIPLGPLDGHFILSWWLPTRLGAIYDRLNLRYGSWLFLGLIVLSIAGIPVFRFLMAISAALLPYITFI
jgi:Zn-dependent protease